MELDDYLENRLFETCEAHGIEPSFAWVNGSEFSFVMHCRRIAYMSSGKNGKNGFAVPVISGEGNCLAPHFNFRIHTIFKLDKGGLVDTIEVASSAPPDRTGSTAGFPPPYSAIRTIISPPADLYSTIGMSARI